MKGDVGFEYLDVLVRVVEPFVDRRINVELCIGRLMSKKGGRGTTKGEAVPSKLPFV
jgi:hypothetical protein